MRNICWFVAVGIAVASAKQAEVKIISQSLCSTTFQVTVPLIETATVITASGTFVRVSVPGAEVALLDEGRPEVCNVPVMLGTPAGAQVSLEILEKELETLDVAMVYPLQPLLLEDEEPGPFQFEREFYEQDTVYPETDAEVVSRGMWRTLGVAVIETHPLMVNPGRGIVIIARRLRLRASYSGGSYPPTIERWMLPIYGSLVNNFTHLQFTDSPEEYQRGIRYLIIADTGFVNDTFLTRFLAGWIRQRGNEDSIIFHDWRPADYGWIKQIIKDVYNSHNPPLLRWVLLVGDYENLPLGIYWKGNSGVEGDFYCAELTDDTGPPLPEVGVARLSVPPYGWQLQTEVNKILAYQKEPSATNTWLTRMTLVAHKEAYPDKYSACIRGIYNMSCTTYFRYAMDTIMGEFCTNQDVHNAIADGTGVLVYRGHGYPENWWLWNNAPIPRDRSWTIEDVEVLPSNGMPVVVLSLCCRNGDITEDDCIAETWMRKPAGGGVACFAATGGTSPKSNHGVCSTLVRCLCDTACGKYPEIGSAPVFDLGSLLMRLDGYLAKVWGKGQQEDIWCYLFLGDPAMPVWSGGMPLAPFVSWHNYGQVFSVEVRVDGRPAEGASVCVMKEPDIYVQGYTDATGRVSLKLQPHSTGLATLTVSEGHAAGAKPHTPILPFDTTVFLSVLSWDEKRAIPRVVKDGGWLTYDSDSACIYGSRGYKSLDFYCYYIDGGRWEPKAPWRICAEERPPYKGSAGCYGGGYVWAVKGNNTPGFFRYAVADNDWQQLANIPPGNSGKNPKGGTDVVYVVLNDTGYVYLLKGYKQDFMRYNTINGQWQQLPNAPDGVKPKWDKGSWLVYDGQNTIYAHKAKYHELWTFDLNTGQWSTTSLQGMPFISQRAGKSKKSKDGGSAAYYNGFIYALKGGNTCEFWRYDIANNSWIELDPMPDLAQPVRKSGLKVVVTSPVLMGHSMPLRAARPRSSGSISLH